MCHVQYFDKLFLSEPASTTNMSGAATNPQASAKFDQSKPTAVAKPAKKIGIQPGNKPSADTMDNRK